MATITIIGLGSMGMGMAQSLLRAGHTVHGYDIDHARTEALVAEGATDLPLQEAAGASDILVSVVLNAAQTELVLWGDEGAAPHLSPDAVVISCATIPPAFARDLAERTETAGPAYLDAPISGGAAKAAEGKLSIMASGSEEAFTRARPALDAMAETVHDLGREAGAGSAMKAVNQLLAGVHIAVMGEALAFATAQALDLGQVVKVIGMSAGNSWMFQNRAPHVVENDYTPRSAIDIWPKDLAIVADIASRVGVPVPVTEAALAQFRAAADAGDGAADDAAVTRVYARAAGLKLPGDD